LRQPIRSQDRSKNSASHPSSESLRNSRSPHRLRLRNSLPQDDASLMPSREPSSRQRESTSLLRSRVDHSLLCSGRTCPELPCQSALDQPLAPRGPAS
jgi:hypothetical protein